METPAMAREIPRVPRRRNEAVWTPLRRGFYSLGRVLCRIVFTLLYRIHSEGTENVPRHGAVLMVANHQSYLDPPVIGCVLRRRRIDFVARRGLWRNRLLAPVIDALCAIPIDEEGGDLSAMREVLRRLEMGHTALIFPEGSRTTDGTVQSFKRGVALLVKRAGCPVIPVAVEGCFDAWPRHRRRPRLGGARIAVAFGPPIPHEELMAGGPVEGLQRLHDEVERLRAGLAAQGFSAQRPARK
jgi:1-acyl-sn-glycerol-3-phosphate acyltransferase